MRYSQEHNLPIFENNDVADLNDYSEKVAEALENATGAQDERIDEQLRNMTLEDPSSAEIVDARGGHNLLRYRFEADETNISANATSITNINTKLNNIDDGFMFDNMKVEKKYDSTTKTHYHITIIPHTDTKGNVQQMKLGTAYDDITDFNKAETPISFAQRKKAEVVTNAGLFNMTTQEPYGILIQNGVVIRDNPITRPNGYYFVIYEDGRFDAIVVTGTTSSDLINAGVKECICGWYPILKNGDYTGYSSSEGAYGQHPRQVIAQNANLDTIILTCNGRNDYDVGMDLHTIATILKDDYNCTFAYNLDGGGSACTVIYQNHLNYNTDDNFSTCREVGTFLYLKKEDDQSGISQNMHEMNYLTGKIIEDTKNLVIPATMDFKAQKIGVRNLVYNSNDYLTSSGYKTLPVNVEEYNNLRNKQITISADIELENAIKDSQYSATCRVGAELSVKFSDDTTEYYTIKTFLTDTAQTLKARIYNTFQVSDKEITEVSTKTITLFILGLGSGTAKIGRPKIEIGNKETGWIPSPETMITTDVEIPTNEFIDGKQVFRKRYDFGALPNATTKNVAHGLTNVKIIDYNGIAYSSSGSTLKLPFVSTNSSAECIRLNTTSTNIVIMTGTDRSGFSECYVDLYYTKTN